MDGWWLWWLCWVCVFWGGKVERYVMYYNSAFVNIDPIYMVYIEDIDAETDLFMDRVGCMIFDC